MHLQVLKCIKILITSQQQALIEQAVGASATTHTLSTPLSGTSVGVSWPDQPSVSTGLLTVPVNTVSSSAIDTYGGNSAGAAGASAGLTSTSSNGEFDVVRVGSMRPHSSSSGSNLAAASARMGGALLPAAAAISASGTGATQVAASIPSKSPGPSLHVIPGQRQQRQASSPQARQLGKLQTQLNLQQQQPKLPPSPPLQQQQQQQPLLPLSQQQQQQDQRNSQQPAAVQKVHLPAVASLSDLLSQQPDVRSSHSRGFASYTGGSARGGTGSGSYGGKGGTTDGGHRPQDL
jgi:hypothetical protein